MNQYKPMQRSSDRRWWNALILMLLLSATAFGNYGERMIAEFRPVLVCDAIAMSTCPHIRGFTPQTLPQVGFDHGRRTVLAVGQRRSP